jgi:hypothetical protein
MKTEEEAEGAVEDTEVEDLSWFEELLEAEERL